MNKRLQPFSLLIPTVLLSLALDAAGLWGQSAQTVESPVYVDESGVLRWHPSGEEVALFGVNYSTPFAHAYRAHKRLRIPHRTAIDRDVAHMARLDLDAFRIHVWEREITDREGNLLENEHLDLLDYLLARLKEHDIKIVLTPIAWWGTGYPEPDPETDGFSAGFSKEQMSHDPAALRAIATYLPQFVEHVNSYTSLSYSDDPDILFIELFNEPWHTEPYPERTAFIDTLVRVVRATGFEKPIFYNINERYDREHGLAVCSADIQGVGGQWYPTGLVSERTIEADVLPNANRYIIPYAELDACRNKARMIYEFDAADVAGSYMYPAMARSFRGAGFQFATMFSYDPVAISAYNTEYPTHYLNLVYTPSKAISLMIAGEVFRREPRNRAYPDYPANNTFGPFRVSYKEGLSEMVTSEAFLYSSDTDSSPERPDLLERVAGVGNSSIVSYEGTGAYFLDRLRVGIWRLEVYPDAVQIAEPFGKPSFDREVARVYWRVHRMKLSLPDLGEDFSVEPADGNRYHPVVQNSSFDMRPGVYLLRRADIQAVDREDSDLQIDSRFWAPTGAYRPAVVAHQSPSSMAADRPLALRVTVASAEPPDSVSLFARKLGWRGFGRFTMDQVGPYEYEVVIGQEFVRPGLVQYAVSVHEGGLTTTFPDGEPGHPRQWDYTGQTFWKTRTLPAESPLIIFDAGRDADNMLWPHPWNYVRFRTSYVNGSAPDRDALRVVVTDFEPEPHAFTVRSFIPSENRDRIRHSGPFDSMVVTARAVTDEPTSIVVALVGQNGSVRGSSITLETSWKDHIIPLDKLGPVALALLPRPYPNFLPYVLEAARAVDTLQVEDIEGVQIALRPGTESSTVDEEAGMGFLLDRILLIQTD